MDPSSGVARARLHVVRMTDARFSGREDIRSGADSNVCLRYTAFAMSPKKNSGVDCSTPHAMTSITGEGARRHTNYTSPWSSMALATLRNPPMLAPFTRLPGVPYFSAVSKQVL
jgi:hypothetical protein